MNEHDQSEIDAAAAEENALLQTALVNHLQHRVVALNLRVKELEAAANELTPSAD